VWGREHVIWLLGDLGLAKYCDAARSARGSAQFDL